EVAHDLQLNRSNSVHNRVYGGRYLYEGDFPYVYPPFVKNRDRATGAWWGFESRLLSTAWQGHRWIAGLEYWNNVRQDQRNDDEGIGCFGTGPAPCLDDRRSSRQWSFYAQDEMEVGDNTYLTLGLRHDRLSAMPGHWSPRLGLVRQTAAAGTFKLLLATAFSDPTVYQRFYNAPGFAVGNPGLMPERMKSLDLTWEGQVGPRSRMSASVYFFRVRDLLALDPVSGLTQNIPETAARGFELEYRHHWSGGAAVRTGYTLQSASLAGGSVENMARHALKANLALPLAGEAWTAGLEAQAMSRRRTGMADGWVPGHAVFNANVLHRPAGARWDASLGVYNLTDRKYADPVALDATVGGPRDRMVQLGRTLRLAFSARF
ncbi:MAG: TonB-dependent receptor, partial [Rhodocyclaceae bacterium]|nr:TonB-dependent receptor [Rhodocyclaceae bacterium]